MPWLRNSPLHQGAMTSEELSPPESVFRWTSCLVLLKWHYFRKPTTSNIALPDQKWVLMMLMLFQGAYPARLKRVLIVTAPLWFKAPFKILRLFIKEKLRDRVSMGILFSCDIKNSPPLSLQYVWNQEVPSVDQSIVLNASTFYQEFCCSNMSFHSPFSFIFFLLKCKANQTFACNLVTLVYSWYDLRVWLSVGYQVTICLWEKLKGACQNELFCVSYVSI